MNCNYLLFGILGSWFIHIISTALWLYIQHMEKLNYNYSFKNIPTSTKTSYQLALIEKIESAIKRMWWKADFFLNGYNKENNTKTSFGFKSRYHPPPCTELEHFEKGLINIINNLKFVNNKNSFQKKPRADITEIKHYMFLLTKPIMFTKCRHLNTISFWKKMLPKLQKSSGKATKINQLGSGIHSN